MNRPLAEALVLAASSALSCGLPLRPSVTTPLMPAVAGSGSGGSAILPVKLRLAHKMSSSSLIATGLPDSAEISAAKQTA